MSTKLKATMLGKTLEVSCQMCYDGQRKPPAPDADKSAANLFRIVTRAKRQVQELASANHWDYFVTVTADPNKIDRTDTRAIQHKWKRYAEYISRKTGSKMSYLVVPEPHPNGYGFHCHGLAACPDETLVPYLPEDYKKLPMAIKQAYHRAKSSGRQIYHSLWMDKHVGYNLWEPVQSPERIQNYITKYIDKNLVKAAEEARRGAAGGSTAQAATGDARRADLYFHSRGLSHPPQVQLDADLELQTELMGLSTCVLHEGKTTLKTAAWYGERVYNGVVVGRTWRVDRENVTSEVWRWLCLRCHLDSGE